ncbi:MAG: ATP-dependent DNA ligase [Solirubrobacterales bacterium]|nr:ATP-dependent DNA ligase [Solirubrobacterales bacterium]
MAPPPDWIEPMLATLTDERDLGEGWVLERKLDGIRCLAFVRRGRVTLLSRTRNPLHFPVVSDALRELGEDAILDGEVVAVDRHGEPLGFQALQRRAQEPGSLTLWAFDLPWRGGEDLRGRPLAERRAQLEQLVTPGGAVARSEVLEGPSRAAYERACSEAWEGVIAKRSDGPYRAGRSRDWLKLKCLFEQEVVVGGFTEPQRSRVGLGALLVGYYEDGALRYAGKVGTGFDTRTLRELRERLDGLEVDAPPFGEPVKPLPEGAHWVAPELVAQVGFAEWTAAGRLRQPRFLGLRDDKPPRDVVREAPA